MTDSVPNELKEKYEKIVGKPYPISNLRSQISNLLNSKLYLPLPHLLQKTLKRTQIAIRYTTVFALITIVTLSPLIYVKIRSPKSASAAWFNEDWAYRKAVNITNSSGSVLTDFQVSLTLDTTDTARFQSTCYDIRVTDTNGNLLPHWLEENGPGCNNSATAIWTKVPSIPTPGTTLYVYYGNKTAPNVSDGNKVFEFFDGFNGTALDTTQWKVLANDYINVSGGYLELDRTAASTQVSAKIPSSSSSIIEFRGIQLLESTSYRNRFYFGTLSGTTFTLSSLDAGAGGNSDYGFFYDGTNAPAEVYLDAWQNVMLDTTSTFNIRFDLHGSVVDAYYRNRTTDTQIHSATNLTPSIANASVNAVSLGVTEQNTSHFKIDSVFVRKYASTLPTNSLAAEEQSPGPVGYWAFNEGYGQTASDSTSNNNDGTLGADSGSSTDDPTWTTEDQCVAGKCLKFDGGDYIDNGDVIGSKMGTAYTVSAWIKTSTISENNVVSSYRSTSVGNAVLFQLDHNNSDARFIIRDDAGNSATATFGNGLTANNWYHLAGVRNGSNVTVYVNGQTSATATATFGTISQNKLLIGALVSGTSTPQASTMFTGFLDEVKVYPYARTAAQIKADYQSGLSGASSSKGTSAVLGTDARKYLSDGLVGYWKMDETSGTSVTDSSGNSNTGTAADSISDNGDGNTPPPVTGTAKFGNGRDFDGTDDYITVNDGSTLDSMSALTVSVWARLDTASGNRWLLYKRHGSSPWFSYNVGFNGTNFTFNVGNSSTTAGAVASSSVSADTWYHIVGTYDGSKVKIYVNAVDSDATPGSITGTVLNSDSTLDFGGYWDNYYLDGKIDEIRIYNKALSSKEITDLYNWAPGPVGYWDFEEGSGNTVYDKGSTSSATLNNGTWSGTGTTHYTSGKYGKAGKFNGSDDYVSLPSISTNFSGGLTVCAWTYFTNTASWARIIDFSESGSSNDNILFARNSTTSNLTYEVYVGNTSGGKVTATGAITNNIWQHFCAAENSAGAVVIYKNGAQIQTGTTSVPANVTRATSYIAKSNWADGYFGGTIDEVKIYNYARSQKQIVEDMNAGHPAVGSPVGSPVLHWKFDEGSGTSTVNNSGRADSTLNGTISGATWAQNGKFGKAMNFSTNQRVYKADHDTLDIGGDLTVSAWVNFTDPYTSLVYNSYGTIAGKSSPNNWNQSYKIYAGRGWSDASYNTNKYKLGFERGTGSSSIDLRSDDDYNDGTWHYVAGVQNMTDGKMYLYIDGKLKKSTANTGTITNTHTFNVGYEDGRGYYNGMIDEVKVYDYALTSDEVKTEYNRGSALVLGALSDTSGLTGGSVASTSASAEYCIPGDTASCTSPIARWDFEEGKDNTCSGGSNDVCDTSGNGNDGAWNGTGTTHWTPGKVGKAGNFNGTDDYVGINSTFTSIASSTTKTVSLWAKSNVSNYGGRARTIVIYRDTNSSAFSITAESGGNFGYVYDPTSGSNIVDSGKAHGTDWHNIVLVQNGSNVTMYVDGVNVSSVSNAEATIGTPQNALIGSASSSEYWNGKIDQVKIYNYARTPAQIAWDYNRGKPVGWWKLDECQGNGASDSAQLNNHGTIVIGASGTEDTLGTCTTSSTAWGNGATGKYNSSLSFDGTDDYVDLAGVSTYKTLSQGTVSVWFKTADDGMLISISNADAANGFNYFYVGNSTGAYSDESLCFALRDTGSVDRLSACYRNGTAYLKDNAWHHAVFAVSDTGNKMYVDGKEVSLTYATGSSSTTGYFFNDTNFDALTIGVRKYNNTFDGYLSSLFDDVRIYNYALTTSQVKQLYNGGAGVRFGPTSGNP